MSAEDALLKHHQRQWDKIQKESRPKRKNRKPEKLVEIEVLAWAKEMGMSLHVVESKAVYSRAAGRYLHSQTSESLPDLIGNFGEFSVWIELKARGRRSTLKDHQREFLVRKIQEGCFACCTDRMMHIDHLFQTWLKAGEMYRQKYLMDDLPRKRHPRHDDLF